MAAYAKQTFQNLQLSLAYRYGESAIPSSGTANRNFWLNRGQDYCVDRIGMKKQASITVSSGTASLPTDFKFPISLLDSDNVIYSQINEEQYSYYSSSHTVFTITGNHSSGFTLKASNDGTFTLTYYFHPSPMSSNSDVCIVPDGEAVVAYAYGMLRKSETDPLGDAGPSLSEAEERIKQMQINQSGNEEQLRFRSLN